MVWFSEAFGGQFSRLWGEDLRSKKPLKIPWFSNAILEPFWGPWRRLGGGQNGTIFELIFWTDFGSILDSIWRPILTPKTTSEEGQGDNRRTFIFIDRVDENEPPGLSNTLWNASQNCFQKSSENGTKIPTPGAPKITLKWHRKWSQKSLQF